MCDAIYKYITIKGLNNDTLSSFLRWDIN